MDNPNVDQLSQPIECPNCGGEIILVSRTTENQIMPSGSTGVLNVYMIEKEFICRNCGKRIIFGKI